MHVSDNGPSYIGDLLPYTQGVQILPRRLVLPLGLEEPWISHIMLGE